MLLNIHCICLLLHAAYHDSDHFWTGTREYGQSLSVAWNVFAMQENTIIQNAVFRIVIKFCSILDIGYCDNLFTYIYSQLKPDMEIEQSS